MSFHTHPCYELLKRNQEKIFRLCFADGDVITAKLLFVDEEYEDFIFDLISVVSSSRPEQYKSPAEGANAALFADLVSAELES